MQKIRHLTVPGQTINNLNDHRVLSDNLTHALVPGRGRIFKQLFCLANAQYSPFIYRLVRSMPERIKQAIPGYLRSVEDMANNGFAYRDITFIVFINRHNEYLLWQQVNVIVES